MGEPLKPPQEPEKPTTGQIITGFLLTLFALPFLFVATCLPAAFLGSVAGPGIAIAVWAIGSIAFGIWRAVVTENPGVRWGIILVIAAAIIAGAVMLWPEAVRLLTQN